jgi:triphosphatase
MRDAAVQREIELKFEADPDSFDRLLALPSLQPTLEDLRTASLRSIYFDTPDHALREAGISLRIREDGNGRIQTIKAARAPSGIALDRMEWEKPVASDEPDLGSIPEPDLKLLSKLKDDIGPIVSIAVRRTIVMVRHEDSIVEVAFDRGSIEGRDGARPFAEIELELKRGIPADLFSLARELAGAAPLRLSFSAKSDRGFGALGEAPTRVKAEAILLKRRMPSGDAFQVIAASCLRHLMANEPILRERGEPEAVHQMRVALRRLRAAITLFKAVVADDQRDAIRSELKWMAGVLGEARDLDVYMAQTLGPARDRHEGDEDLESLVQQYEERRQKAYAAVQETIASPRFLNGVIDAAAWIQTGEWLALKGEARQSRGKSIVAHAEEELTRRWRKIRKRGKNLAVLEPEDRHQLRIEIKKLRYAAEFFESLFKGSAARKAKKSAREVLESLQETLGELNDIAVGDDLEGTPAAEMLRQEQLARVDALLSAAEDQYRTFADLRPFWTRAK